MARNKSRMGCKQQPPSEPQQPHHQPARLAALARASKKPPRHSSFLSQLAVALAIVAALAAVCYAYLSSSPSPPVVVIDNEPTAAAHGLAGCADRDDSCGAWAESGECETNPVFMNSHCNASCGACGDSSRKKAAPPRHKGSLVGKCRDDNSNCANWAGAGECDSNPGYMRKTCQLSCNACDGGASNPACVRPNETAAASRPGDISAMFERALALYPQYTPTVHSRDPWVVTFDNFITDEEADRMLELCSKSFERSMAGDTLSPVRTSHQCWCQRACTQDPLVRRVTERIGGLTGTPEANSEYFQVVRYEEGQFYKVHHDQNSAPFTPQGARLYTFFMCVTRSNLRFAVSQRCIVCGVSLQVPEHARGRRRHQVQRPRPHRHAKARERRAVAVADGQQRDGP